MDIIELWKKLDLVKIEEQKRMFLAMANTAHKEFMQTFKDQDNCELNFIVSLINRVLEIYESSIEIAKRGSLIVLGSLARIQIENIYCWINYRYSENKEKFVKDFTSGMKMKLSKKIPVCEKCTSELKADFKEFCKYIHVSEKMLKNSLKKSQNKNAFSIGYDKNYNIADIVIVFKKVEEITIKAISRICAAAFADANMQREEETRTNNNELSEIFGRTVSKI
ncbi:MAG: hypothetical protein FWE36_08125 [Erysipelotrichales bacterium]|nr:hypothetical protein [Erysipelotrichales bacterium]